MNILFLCKAYKVPPIVGFTLFVHMIHANNTCYHDKARARDNHIFYGVFQKQQLLIFEKVNWKFQQILEDLRECSKAKAINLHTRVCRNALALSLLTVTSECSIILYKPWSAGAVSSIWVQVSILSAVTAVGAWVVTAVV